MDTVYKYAMPLTDVSDIGMHKGATLLHVDKQYDDIFIWARVDTKAPLVRRRFRLAGTGHDLAIASGAIHVGTVVYGVLVFHLFDLGEGAGVEG